jgi:hypothetical protein
VIIQIDKTEGHDESFFNFYLYVPAQNSWVPKYHKAPAVPLSLVHVKAALLSAEDVGFIRT